MHRLHREGKASQATFAGRLEGYKTCHSLANQITPRVSPVPLIQSFQHFYVISRRIFFFREMKVRHFKKNCLVKNMRRDLISKKKRKKMRNYCGLANDTSEKKKLRHVCVQSHICLHTRLNASRLPRSALSAVDLN